MQALEENTIERQGKSDWRALPRTETPLEHQGGSVG